MGVIVFLIALPIGLCIGALILIGAVAITNSVLAGSGGGRRYDDDDDDDYDYVPKKKRRRRSRRGETVPDPPFGQAVVIVLVAWLVNFAVHYVMSLAIGAGANPRGQMLAYQLVSLPVSFLVMASMLNAMLPTSFGKACLVTLFCYLIGIAIAIAIGGILFAVGVGLWGAGR